jgi:hypothetical protein
MIVAAAAAGMYMDVCTIVSNHDVPAMILNCCALGETDAQGIRCSSRCCCNVQEFPRKLTVIAL